MKVEQLMRHGVLCCHPDDTLSAVARIMWEHDCGCVAVRDTDGRVIGMITDRDVCMAAYLQGGPLGALRVSSAMSKQLFSCRPDDSVADAEGVMREHRVRRLPVIDAGGRVVGILSLNDIATEAGHETARRAKKDVSFAEVGETLQAICKPHDIVAAAPRSISPARAGH
jgi:CBS domain-containing protein